MLDRLADILNIYGKYVINEGTEPRIYHEELGLSELQEWAIVYNPKVSATVEIPTGTIDVVPDTKQVRSADDLLKRYGQKEFRKIVTVGEACIFCDSPADRIDAAHAVPWADTKNMHPTNGLPMCKNHHAHYDIGNIIIDWHDGFTVYSQTRQLIPMSETRDRMWYHLDELSQQNNLSLDELLQQQRTHIEANVKKQMEENKWVDEPVWKIFS